MTEIEEETSKKQRSSVRAESINTQMTQSYLDYAYSVIIGRAIPDVRDGLKPVQRRIVYSMYTNKFTHTNPYRKCARIVGDVLGKYHPHGDASVYDSLVRMAQDFSLRYPLIDGQGNFGSIDGDPPAAMRYCITGDSLILTENGIIPIKELTDLTDNKTSHSDKENGYEEDIDIEILSTGNTNKASKFFDSGSHDIIQVNTNLGYSIKGSKNHPILCWAPDINGKPTTIWKTLETLSMDDVVVLNRKGLFTKQNYDTKPHIPEISENRRRVEFPEEITEELAFSLGALIAEGSVSDTEQQRLSFNNKDHKYYEKVKNGLLNSFPGLTVNEREEYNGWKEFSLHVRDVLDFLYSIGLTPVKSDKKEIPFSVLRSSKPVIASFLKALFEGDGSIQINTDARQREKTSNLTYTSKSVKLLNQLKNVLLSFGITTSHLVSDPRNDVFRIVILGLESKRKFFDEIGFFSSRKAERFRKNNEINTTRLSKTDFIPYLTEYFRNKYNNRFDEFFQKQNIDRYNSLHRKINHIRTLVENNDALYLNQILEDNYLYQGISSINQLPKEHVYSIRVDSDCHSFTANGFINHNTEARLDVIASELIADIEKDTVGFVPNFDESLKEPVFMPSKIPNLMINGASGIAVGMSTNMPPYNLREVVQGIIAVIDNPYMYPEELSKYIKGPDFPTKGIIMGRKGIRNIINMGRGKITVRGRVEIEEKCMIITEIPYQVNKLRLVENIARLINHKKIRGVSDLRDESNREGIRIVLDLTRDADPNAIKYQLFSMTRLQSSYSILNRVLVDNNGLQPAILNIMALIKAHIDNREQIIIRRTQYDLDQAKKRLHIADGLLIAIQNIDEVIQVIKKSSDTTDARQALMTTFSLTEIQTDAILEMPLRRLTSLQTKKLQDEKITIIENIQLCEQILTDKKMRMTIIKEELHEIDKKYGDDRLTEIEDAPEEADDPEEEQLKVIPEETCVIILTENQYIKRMTLKTYQAQNRGGKGKKGINKREEDIIRDVYVVSSHDKVLLFTKMGRVYSKYAYEIPLMSRTSRGKAFVNFVGLKPDEQIVHIVPVADFFQEDFLIFVTKRGMVKRTNIREFKNIRKTGILAINLRENDELVNVKLSEEDYYILIATENGYAIKFSDLEVRPLSRKAMGVVGIRLREEDSVVDMVIGDNETDVITITKNGYGKRSKVELYRETRRGGKGVINIKFHDPDDCVTAIKAATDEDLLIATTNGILIRVPSLSLRSLSRSAKGVKVIELNEDDFVSSVALCEHAYEDYEGDLEDQNNESEEDEESDEESDEANEGAPQTEK
ncbi:MAG: hypothetical protein JW776_07245 [Candidatus Lokiarchaeota archaeon]|nr:hypothetical protein [Candidatus Lokiarchaeota archaeon]